MIDELTCVLIYPKFKLPEEEVTSASSYYGMILRIVDPRINVDVIREDVADNEVLACALSVKASTIVTGDRHLLALGKFKGVKISAAKEYFGLLG